MSNNHPSTRHMREVKAAFRIDCAADDLACWLCGQPIDYDAPYDDYANDSRFELDHYYPASTHPEHYEDPDNFRPSHAGCNRQRSDKAPSAGLGTLSREWF